MRNNVVALRDDLGMTFQEIGAYLNIKGDTARKQYIRSQGETGRVYNSKWTKDTVIEAGYKHIREFGSPPTVKQWDRGSNGRYPSTSTVKKLFGKWSEFMLELGYFRGQKIV